MGGTQTDFTVANTDAWVRGEDTEFSLQILGSNGSGFDLTDVLVEFEVKKSDGDPEPPLLHLDSTLGIITGLLPRSQSGMNVGWVDGVALAAQTFALPAGSYRYDVFATLPGSGYRKRSHYGVLQLVSTPNDP